MPKPQKLIFLRQLREISNVTQSSMAEYLGLSSKSGRIRISRWENGEEIPPIKYRSVYIHFLLEKLDLREDIEKFDEAWQTIHEEWGWPLLSSTERSKYITKKKDTRLKKTNPQEGSQLGQIRFNEAAIEIGLTLKNDITSSPLLVPIKDLTQHGLITGITGSGKTNTCLVILSQLWSKHKIPFLVIDPYKTEFRYLMRIFPNDINVFTFGNIHCSPLMINPLEVVPGVGIETHIKYLVNLFQNTFSLGYMGYILEDCLIEVYQDFGFDILTKYESTSGKKFPTLQDLYEKVNKYSEKVSYDSRVHLDITSAINGRIGSMLRGSKGLSLNVNQSTPLSVILSKPTVIELTSLDEEFKTFVAGLLLINIYEHRISPSHTRNKHEILSHCLLLNEASKLFHSNPNSTNGGLINILSEIRAHGEGVLLTDQVITNLAPEAIKKTSLRIFHQTLASDERSIIQNLSGIKEETILYLTHLPPGQALICTNSMEDPEFVQVPHITSQFFPRIEGAPSDEEIYLNIKSMGV